MCGQNVYLNADGSCVNGHAATYVSNTYEVPGAVPAGPGTSTPAPYTPQAAAAPPKKRHTGLVIALVIVGVLLLCGCGIGGFFLFGASSLSSSSSSPSEPTASAIEKAQLKTALSLVKAMAKGDAELMKSLMPAATVVAMPAEFWTAFVESTAESASSVYGKETWKGATITVATQSNKGPGTMTLKISSTDPDSVDIHTVLGDKTTSDVVVKVGDEGGKWKVLSLTSEGTTIPFDAEGFKAFIEAANQ